MRYGVDRAQVPHLPGGDVQLFYGSGGRVRKRIVVHVLEDQNDRDSEQEVGVPPREREAVETRTRLGERQSLVAPVGPERLRNWGAHNGPPRARLPQTMLPRPKDGRKRQSAECDTKG